MTRLRRIQGKLIAGETVMQRQRNRVANVSQVVEKGTAGRDFGDFRVHEGMDGYG
jgi:hypothetical protein